MAIEPGGFDDPISVRLRECEIGFAPVYDAISYVWGDPKQKIQIYCNGIPVMITTNLHWALVRVRLPNRPRIVWADALCINQADPDERSHQVAVMGNIYAHARFVLACIGEDEDGRANDIASLLDKLDSVPRGVLPSQNQPTETGGLVQEDSGWAAIAPLLQMPWFSRLWVLQEVGLAREPRVLYGQANFSYRTLMFAMKYFQVHGGRMKLKFPIPMRLIHTDWADWTSERPGNPRYTLLDLFDHAALQTCQDPRDRVYALLGHPLCNGNGTSGPIIVHNYRKHFLVVFEEVTELLLRTVGLRALASVEHNPDTIDRDSPSWVI